MNREEGYGTYSRKEIANNIDTAIQLAMLHTDETNWDLLQDTKTRLFEQFDITE